jgi:hypothetical protein
MKGGRKSVKVIKTLIMLRQVVMNVEMMAFPFPSSGSVTFFVFNIKTWISVIPLLGFEVVQIYYKTKLYS